MIMVMGYGETGVDILYLAIIRQETEYIIVYYRDGFYFILKISK